MNGEYKKAIQIYRGILRSQEIRYGAQSSQTMETLGILGFLYIQHKHDEEALKCLSSVLKWQQTSTTDPHHPCVKHVWDTVKKIEERIQGEVSVWI
mmetsp:Transcript_32829/g.75566  ORF Transcript_32829/g.75566 Transcript_32829/m.75566 type:complete len:96 (+) Transcript_32829:627-914(+)